MADIATVRDLETKAAIAAALLREELDLLCALRRARALVPELAPALEAARASSARVGAAYVSAACALEAALSMGPQT